MTSHCKHIKTCSECAAIEQAISDETDRLRYLHPIMGAMGTILSLCSIPFSAVFAKTVVPMIFSPMMVAPMELLTVYAAFALVYFIWPYPVMWFAYNTGFYPA